MLSNLVLFGGSMHTSEKPDRTRHIMSIQSLNSSSQSQSQITSSSLSSSLSSSSSSSPQSQNTSPSQTQNISSSQFQSQFQPPNLPYPSFLGDPSSSLSSLSSTAAAAAPISIATNNSSSDFSPAQLPTLLSLPLPVPVPSSISGLPPPAFSTLISAAASQQPSSVSSPSSLPQSKSPLLSSSSNLSSMLLSMKCEVCDDTSSNADYYCQQCGQFFCEGCQRAHKRIRGTTGHVFISREEAVVAGNSRTLAAPRTMCREHPLLEISTFCINCRVPVCAECGIRSHSMHAFANLSDVIGEIKENISQQIHQIKERGQNLSKSVSLFNTAMESLDPLAQESEQTIHFIFDRFSRELNQRKEELLGEIDTAKENRKKELVLERDHIVSIIQEIGTTLHVAEQLLNEGNEVDIALGRAQVSSNLERLANIPCETNPGREPLLDFAEEIVQNFSTTIKKFRPLPPSNLSTERSKILIDDFRERVLVNEIVKFGIAAVDKEGHQMTKGGLKLTTRIDFDSPEKLELEAKVIDNLDGTYSIEFQPPREGKYHVSVSFKGQEIHGLPLTVVVVERPIYRRDYNKIVRPVMQFGSKGQGDGQFDRPFAVCANSKLEIIATDAYNHRIQIFDRDGHFLRSFGSKGTGHGQFNEPRSVHTDPRNDQIYVADVLNHRVQVFDPRGNFTLTFGSEGIGDGQFNRPYGLVLDPEGNVVVADFCNNRIQIFDHRGRFKRKFGVSGKGLGQLNGPVSVGVQSNGVFIVSEIGNNRLQMFDRDGNFIRQLGVGQIQQPRRLVVDSDDTILACDGGNNRILVFNKQGEMIGSFGVGHLDIPTGIRMDREGRIVVSESGGQRISVF